jgi:hypothetical protein
MKAKILLILLFVGMGIAITSCDNPKGIPNRTCNPRLA